MSEKGCEQFGARLVEYADGELPTGESAAVAEHVARCPHCRETVAALRRSIEVAGVIWQAGEADLRDVRVPVRSRWRRFQLQRPALVAAGILLLVGVSLVWRVVPRVDRPAASDGQRPTIVAMQRTVARAGVAMELLGAAEYLAEQPGGEAIAHERYRYIVDAYPETEAAAACRSRL